MEKLYTHDDDDMLLSDDDENIRKWSGFGITVYKSV